MTIETFKKNITPEIIQPKVQVGLGEASPTEVLADDAAEHTKIFTEATTCIDNSIVAGEAQSGADMYRELNDQMHDTMDYIANSKTMSLKDTARALNDIWAFCLSGAKARNAVATGSSESDSLADDAVAEMMYCLPDMSAERMKALLGLPEAERGKLDDIVMAAIGIFHREADKASDMHGRLYFLRQAANMQGYARLTEKRWAIARGEIADDGLKKSDVILDEWGDTPLMDTQKIWTVLEDIGVPSPEEAITAMYERLKNPAEGSGDSPDCLDAKKTKAWLMGLASKMMHIGPENAKLLREKCGFVNFADMPNELLDRMVRFAKGDEALMEYLHSKEVAVVIKDASNDYNGAFRNIYDKYETTDGATLVFEVPAVHDTLPAHRQVANTIFDMYYLLRQYDIDPSLLVVAGHGQVGSIDMGGAEIGTGGGLPLRESGLLPIMQHMKPDRDGNCSIVFDSCSQDAPGDGGEDDTTLTQTAIDIQNTLEEAGASPLGTYKVYGVNMPYQSRLFEGGVMVAMASDDSVRVGRVIVTESGKILRHLRDENDRDTILLPMLLRNGRE